MDTSFTQSVVIGTLLLLVLYHITLQLRTGKNESKAAEEAIADDYSEIKLNSKQDIRTQLLTKMCEELTKKPIKAEPNQNLVLEEYFKLYILAAQHAYISY